MNLLVNIFTYGNVILEYFIPKPQYSFSCLAIKFSLQVENTKEKETVYGWVSTKTLKCN